MVVIVEGGGYGGSVVVEEVKVAAIRRVESNPHMWPQAQLANMECPCDSKTLELPKTLEKIIS